MEQSQARRAPRASSWRPQGQASLLLRTLAVETGIRHLLAVGLGSSKSAAPLNPAQVLTQIFENVCSLQD